MLPVRKRVGQDGRIAIGDMLRKAQIKPGDLVQITAADNKITIKTVKKAKPKGAVEAAAGILKDQPELVEEMLHISVS